MQLNEKEIRLLREFYVDKTRASKLRKKYNMEPWHVTAKYRNLPKEEFEEAKAVIYGTTTGGSAA